MPLLPVALLAELALFLSLPLGFWLTAKVPSAVTSGWAAAFMRQLGRRLNRSERGERNLLARGTVSIAVICLSAGFVGGMIDRLYPLMPPLFFSLSLILLALSLECGRLLRLQRHLAEAAESTDHALLIDAAGRGFSLSGHAILTPDRLDRASLVRLAADQSLLIYARGCVTPIFWLLLGGLVGLGVTAALTVMAVRSAVIALRIDGMGSGSFAVAGERLDQLLGYVPLRVAAILWCLAAAFAPGARPDAALSALRGEGRRLLGLAEAWLFAAASGSLTDLYARPIIAVIALRLQTVAAITLWALIAAIVVILAL